MSSILPDVRYPPVLDISSAKSSSPVSEYLGDEEATSICPLLTPSPPGNFDHPLALDEPQGLAYERQISPSSTDPELASLPALALNGIASVPYNGLVGVPNENHGEQDDIPQLFKPADSVQSGLESSSSSSSVLQDTPACAQLLNNHHYQHLSKGGADDAGFICQENGGKPPMTGIQLAINKSTKDYCFMSWNWPLVRRISFILVMSILVGCVCIIVALIAHIPKTCNPRTDWWQGSLFYEVFPASFQDTTSDGMGDFKGLIRRIDYFESLGIRAVRFNSIFLSTHYPEHYDQVHNLTTIDPALGTMSDFRQVVNQLHKRNISVILDLTIYPYVSKFSNSKEIAKNIELEPKTFFKMKTKPENQSEDSSNGENNQNPESEVDHTIREVIHFWLKEGVDGFYLKGLEHFTNDPQFVDQLREWKKLLNFYSTDGNEKIIMCSHKVLSILEMDTDQTKLTFFLNRINLIDVRLHIEVNSTQDMAKQINSVLKGHLYKEPGNPWIHWHIGSVDTPRLASHLNTNNGSLGVLLLTLMLPGTPSLFYGDEIGLLDYVNLEHQDLPHPPQLVPMHWVPTSLDWGFTAKNIIPWLSPSMSISTVKAEQQNVIGLTAKLRQMNPAIYMNGFWKDHTNIPNCEVRYAKDDVIIIERWYPRKPSFAILTNLGQRTFNKDLSSIFFGGYVVADLNGRIGQYITFNSVTLYPGESMIVKLDK